MSRAHHKDCDGCKSSHSHEHHPLTVAEIVENGLKQLKAAGYKMTKKREEILLLFAENQRYLSAKYIHDKLSEKYPTMSYNTTYRNIYDFVEEGLLEATEYNQEQMFRINCWQCGHDESYKKNVYEIDNFFSVKSFSIIRLTRASFSYSEHFRP